MSLDGDAITYDQPSVSYSALTSRIFINNSISIEGLSSNEQPKILIDFSQNSYGFSVLTGKSFTLKNVDVSTLNNLLYPLSTGDGTVFIDGLVKVK